MRIRSAIAVGIVTSIFAVTCGEASTWNTLSGAAPSVIGHRGVPDYEPENSLPGYGLAASLGADLLETDVQMTSDGVAVIMHDETLTRTTNVEALFPGRASYAVAEFTLAEIKQLMLKTVDGSGVTDYEVPTLSEFLDSVNAYNALNGSDVGVLVELKGSYDPAANEAVVEALVAKGFGETGANGQVQSFSTQNVAEMAALVSAANADVFVAQLGLGAVPVGANDAFIVSSILTDPFGAPVLDSTGNYIPLDGAMLSLLATYTDAIAMYYPLLDVSLIELAHSYDLEIYAWTFDESDFGALAALMEPYLEVGLDGFITNQTDLANSVIEAFGGATVPLPAGLPLLASGIAAMAYLRRRAKV